MNSSDDNAATSPAHTPRPEDVAEFEEQLLKDIQRLEVRVYEVTEEREGFAGYGKYVTSYRTIINPKAYAKSEERHD